jgi:hypothetical protein
MFNNQISSPHPQEIPLESFALHKKNQSYTSCHIFVFITLLSLSVTVLCMLLQKCFETSCIILHPALVLNQAALLKQRAYIKNDIPIRNEGLS